MGYISSSSKLDQRDIFNLFVKLKIIILDLYRLYREK